MLPHAALGRHVPEYAAHAVCKAERHEPSERQHAQESCGQGFGEQTVLGPWNIGLPEEPRHVFCWSDEQCPSSKQHAPGCGQGVGEQTEPGDWGVPAAARHAADCTRVQDPSVKQQAPG